MCDDAYLWAFEECFKEKRWRNVAHSIHSGRAWAMTMRESERCEELVAMEMDRRLCLKLYGAKGLEEEGAKAMRRQWEGDERWWLPVFDCCYRGCRRRGTVVWRWQTKRVFFCEECEKRCRKEHRMKVMWKDFVFGTVSIWGLRIGDENAQEWVRNNKELQADLGLKQSDEAWQ